MPEESRLPSPLETESVSTPPDLSHILVDAVDPSLSLEMQHTDAQFDYLHNLNLPQFQPCQSLLIDEPQLWQPVFLNISKSTICLCPLACIYRKRTVHARSALPRLVAICISRRLHLISPVSHEDAQEQNHHPRQKLQNILPPLLLRPPVDCRKPCGYANTHNLSNCAVLRRRSQPAAPS